MPEPRKTPSKRASRDREATERAILDAALALLAEEGFHAFGVNEIARRAGCDKQLLYRYFGGTDGLVDAVGSALAAQLRVALDGAVGGPPPATYAGFVKRLLLALVDVFRHNALLRAIAAWEVAAHGPVVARLSAARAKPLQAWVTRQRGDLAPPPGVDAGAINAVLIAAVQQLALASAGSGAFSGVALRSAADWERIQDTVARLVDSAYAG